MALEEMDRLLARLARGDAIARIGILDDPVLALRLWWNELGTKTAPPRPTLTAAWDESEGAIDRGLRRAARTLVAGDVTTGVAAIRPVAKALEELVVDRIDGDTPPELARSTIAARRRRGNTSTRTLVDTRKMLEAVEAQVRPAPPGLVPLEPAGDHPAIRVAPRRAPGRDRRGRFS